MSFGRVAAARPNSEFGCCDNQPACAMPHASTLIATIVVGIGLAFILGTIANRLRISPLVGYLLAGVAVGPFTPGYTADQVLAPQLAEIGVILLMFGIGLHFSLKDLFAIGAIVVPGAALSRCCCITSRIPARASCSGWRCCRSRSVSRSPRRNCSTCPSHWAPSSPA